MQLDERGCGSRRLSAAEAACSTAHLGLGSGKALRHPPSGRGGNVRRRNESSNAGSVIAAAGGLSWPVVENAMTSTAPARFGSTSPAGHSGIASRYRDCCQRGARCVASLARRAGSKERAKAAALLPAPPLRRATRMPGVRRQPQQQPRQQAADPRNHCQVQTAYRSRHGRCRPRGSCPRFRR